MAPLTAWLDTPLAAPIEPRALVLRYLAAFGPASVADIRAWSGLTGVAEAVDALGDRLRRFRDIAGVELLDVPEAPRPDPDIELPVRLLGGFDGLILGFADRSRFLAPEHAARISTANGLFHPLFLIDGRVAGRWIFETDRRRARVAFSPFMPIPPSARAALSAEAEGLMADFAPEATDRDVAFAATD
jgi:hypothetical protein